MQESSLVSAPLPTGTTPSLLHDFPLDSADTSSGALVSLSDPCGISTAEILMPTPLDLQPSSRDWLVASGSPDHPLVPTTSEALQAPDAPLTTTDNTGIIGPSPCDGAAASHLSQNQCTHNLS
jgi:hypothetical protein